MGRITPRLFFEWIRRIARYKYVSEIVVNVPSQKRIFIIVKQSEEHRFAFASRASVP